MLVATVNGNTGSNTLLDTNHVTNDFIVNSSAVFRLAVSETERRTAHRGQISGVVDTSGPTNRLTGGAGNHVEFGVAEVTRKTAVVADGDAAAILPVLRGGAASGVFVTDTGFNADAAELAGELGVNTRVLFVAVRKTQRDTTDGRRVVANDAGTRAVSGNTECTEVRTGRTYFGRGVDQRYGTTEQHVRTVLQVADAVDFSDAIGSFRGMTDCQRTHRLVGEADVVVTQREERVGTGFGAVARACACSIKRVERAFVRRRHGPFADHRNAECFVDFAFGDDAGTRLRTTVVTLVNTGVFAVVVVPQAFVEVTGNGHVHVVAVADRASFCNRHGNCEESSSSNGCFESCFDVHFGFSFTKRWGIPSFKREAAIRRASQPLAATSKYASYAFPDGGKANSHLCEVFQRHCDRKGTQCSTRCPR